MYKISLVTMPLATLTMPSLALTQLQAVVRKSFGADEVQADLHYLHHDFALYVGLPAYDELISFAHHPAGLGDWFFRAAAFPEAPDNADAYFQRYYPAHAPQNRAVREMVMAKRAGLLAHFEAMIDRYELDKVDMVGFTSMFSQNVATLAMARLIKARNPEVVIVVGGANCEGIMGRELIQHAPMVDYVFSGPSLRSFPLLLRALVDGDAEGAHRIDGVFTRRNRVQEAGCSSTTLVTLGGGDPVVRMFGEENDINELVEFDYAPFLARYEAYFPGREQAVLLYETSRGCWWGERAHCTFCGLNGSTISYRSMREENAFKVFNDLFQHADRVSEIQSVDNILPKSYLTDVLPFLDTPEQVALFYEVKADLDEEDFQVLSKARVLRIQPGIEALNTSTLKLMRKGTSVFQNLSFLVNARRYEIIPAWNLLIGFPGEEAAVYEKYHAELHLLTHLFPPSGVFPVRFDRFSPYYEEQAHYGLELQPLDWYELTYPFPAEALANLAYYFADQNYMAPYAMNAARWVGKLRDKVERWKAMWADGTPPELRLTEHAGTAYVYDSRSGVPVEYPLSEDARRVLDGLATAKKPANLAKELPAVDVDGEIARLLERGLIFHEGGRYMSLIVPPARPIAIPLSRTDFAAVAAVA
jgi:ribosomal peptide maturation radical SAM protein 1